MNEQTEQDFRDIERARDLPPDEPHQRGMDCPVCGTEDVTLIGTFRDLWRCERCDHEWDEAEDAS